MASFNGRNYTTFRGLNLQAGNGALRFETPSITPVTTTGERLLYVNSSNQLIFNDGSSATTLGSAGSVANFSLNDAYDDGHAITVDATGVTLNGSIASGVLVIANTSSGALISLSHTTATNVDILGTGSSWQITGQGVATFDEVILGDDDPITFGATSDASIQWVNASSVLRLAGAVDFADAVTYDASSTIVMTGTAGTDVVTVTAGDLVVSDGSLTMTDADNAATLSITNNTATTANVFLFTGSGVFSGTGASSFFRVSQTGLTTGTAVTVIANAATSSVGVVDFSMTGLTGGSALRITAGGANLTSGGKLVELAMGAATDGSGLTVTTTGTYTGAGVLRVVANSATSATGLLNVSGTGVTSGSLVLVTSSTANFTTGGKMIELAMVAATAGNGLSVVTTGAYAGTGLIIASAGAMATGVMVSLTSTTGLTSGSLIRATSSTAGAIATNGAISFTATGNFTTVAAVGYVSVQANSTAAGFIMDISGTALTTGVGLAIQNGTSAMTSGSLLRVTAAGTGAIATNGIVSLTHNGNFTSTSATDGGFVEIKANDTTAGVVFNLVADALTTGLGMHLSNGSSAMTSGSLLRVTTGGTGAIATNGIVSFTHTGDFTSTSATDGGFVEIKANDTTAGTAFNLVADALTTGLGMHLSNGSSNMTTGSLLRVTAGGTGAIATNGLVSLTHSGNYTSTSATNGGFVEIKAASTTAGTLVNIVGAALTTGIGVHISNGTAATTTGSLLRVTAGGVGAVATNGVVSFVHTGVYTSTTVGFLNVSASATTGGTVATITGAAVTDGTGLQISCASITTGKHFNVLGAAGASHFSIAVNGLTTIAGSAKGTDALVLTAGDMTLTSGNIELTSGFITSTPQSIVNANTAIDIVTRVTTISNNGASTHTLADGVVGQEKIIVMNTYTADAVITPSNFVGTTITLNAAGDTWYGIFTGTEWRTLALGGTAAVA